MIESLLGIVCTNVIGNVLDSSSFRRRFLDMVVDMFVVGGMSLRI